MASFGGTAGNDQVTPTIVSAGVTRSPAGSFPGAGADTLEGGDGSDTLRGGDGGDLVANRFWPNFTEDNNADQLFGEGGNDTLIAGALDSADGGAGNDLIIVIGNSSPTALTGGIGNDTLQAGTAGTDLSGATLIGLERIEVSASGNFGGTNMRADQLDDVPVIAAISGSVGFIGLIAGGTATFATDPALTRLAIVGSAQAETLTQAANSTAVLEYEGGSGNGSVIARAGADTLEGGDGSDTLRGGDGGDLVANRFWPNFTEDNNADQLFGEGGNDTLIAGALDSADGGAGNDLIIVVGNSSPTALTGGIGNDTLQAGTAGTDLSGATLIGLERIEVSASGNFGGTNMRADQLDDVPVIAAISGSVGFIGLIAGGTATFATDPALTRLAIVGSAQAETLTQAANSTAVLEYEGGSGNGSVIARAGADTLEGGDGSDTLRGGDGGDLVANRFWPNFTEDNNADQLFGEGGNDTLIAGALDSADGGAGNDLIIVVGNSSPTALTGGIGNDTLQAGTAGTDLSGATLIGLERIEVSASGNFGGTNMRADQLDDVPVIAAISGSVGFIGLIAGGTATFATDPALTRLAIVGSAQAETLTQAANSTAVLEYEGGSGNGSVIARAGADTLEGGDGSDTLRGGDGGDLIANRFWPNFTEDNNADQLFGEGGNDTLIAGALDSADGGAGNDRLEALGAATLTGATGSDTLIGSVGNDHLVGAEGIDTASYESSGNAVTVSLAVATAQVTGGGGTDVLSGIENLIGGSGSDRLTGNAGQNTLRGRTGNDTLDGAGGSDTASYEGAGAVTVDLGIAAPQATGAGTDQLISIENLIGGGGHDVLTGNGAANVIEGGAGNDTLAALGGIDTASYAGAASRVVVDLALAAAQNTQGAGSDLLSGFENLIGSAFNDVLRGNSGNNALTGGAGNDDLLGGDGSDSLDGGAGRDTANYAGAAGGVTVSLAVAGGQATGGAGVDSLTAIENITGSSFADQLTGDGVANRLRGGARNDTLVGSGGNDTLVGEAGNDLLNGGDGIDTASYAGGAAVIVDLGNAAFQNTGGAGLDRLIDVENLDGGAGNDTLSGNAVGNRLAGANGDDWLAGGGGDDVLVGDAGADRFVFAPSGGSDLVTDFSESEDQLGIGGFGAGFDTVAEIVGAAAQVGADVVIVLPDPGGAATSTTIVLQDFLLAQLDAADFAFISP